MKEEGKCMQKSKMSVFKGKLLGRENEMRCADYKKLS